MGMAVRMSSAFPSTKRNKDHFYQRIPEEIPAQIVQKDHFLRNKAYAVITSETDDTLTYQQTTNKKVNKAALLTWNSYLALCPH